MAALELLLVPQELGPVLLNLSRARTVSPPRQAAQAAASGGSPDETQQRR